MKNITDLMLKFKEAIRHSWNEYFRDCGSPTMLPEVQEAFDYVERGFFQAIVLSPLKIAERSTEYRKHPLPFIIVKIDDSDYIREIPLLIGTKEKSGNTTFEKIIITTKDNDMSFYFYDFFDWSFYEYIDIPYVRAKIVNMPAMPDAVGKIALIEQRYCQFFINKKAR